MTLRSDDDDLGPMTVAAFATVGGIMVAIGIVMLGVWFYA